MSRGLGDVYKRQILSDVGSNMGPKWRQNQPKVAAKRESDMVFDSEPFFLPDFQ